MAQLQPGNPIFRLADQGDIDGIIKIHNLNVFTTQSSHEKGFLLMPVTAEIIAQNRAKSMQYFVAARDTEILGFTLVAPLTLTQDYTAPLYWTNPAILEKTREAPERHIFISLVAIHPQFMVQGVGHFLYQSLFSEFSDYYFSAFVVNKPVKNQRSINFHLKQGFTLAATMQREQFLYFKDYESWLFFRI
ncbi:GNAT family N-acetyltransferase [Spirulina subsalsa FACHB-351]|uniref:GNAT family N-acetyltransferase n=1 Tax=Spirulina subsalsa FACHB-351 TaxID=234711 RepID=A0ABT3LAI3_9CYAN|nr:GNAT family N-acetyltransferase [Spirulina subsalsa]MCW6038142.1 GNAT family N-acetyltransferase [Spirulina subsalsa FACHB-351]